MNRAAFLAMVGAALVASEIPLIGLPLKWVETYFHEISHGLAALATGGRIMLINLNYDGSGLLGSIGGWPVVISFAGYAGASLWGLAIYRVGSGATPNAGRRWSTALAVCVGISVLLWAQGLETFVIGGLIIAIFVLATLAHRFGVAHIALAFLGVSVALSALRAPLVLLVVGGKSDAANLAQLTYLPRIVWIALWAAFALFVLYRMWRLSARLPSMTRKRGG